MERLGRLLFACSIVSVHVVDLVSIVVDAYRVPRISLFHEQHYCVVDDLSTLSEETNVDRCVRVEFIAVARFVRAYHHLLLRRRCPRGTASRESSSVSSLAPNAPDNRRAASARDQCLGGVPFESERPRQDSNLRPSD